MRKIKTKAQINEMLDSLYKEIKHRGSYGGPDPSPTKTVALNAAFGALAWALGNKVTPRNCDCIEWVAKEPS